MEGEKNAKIIASALRDVFESSHIATSNLEPANVVDALSSIARALHQLGNADASTPMGGLEALGVAISQSSERIQSGLNAIAEAIENVEIRLTSFKGGDA